MGRRTAILGLENQSEELGISFHFSTWKALQVLKVKTAGVTVSLFTPTLGGTHRCPAAVTALCHASVFYHHSPFSESCNQMRKSSSPSGFSFPDYRPPHLGTILPWLSLLWPSLNGKQVLSPKASRGHCGWGDVIRATALQAVCFQELSFLRRFLIQIKNQFVIDIKWGNPHFSSLQENFF